MPARVTGQRRAGGPCNNTLVRDTTLRAGIFHRRAACAALSVLAFAGGLACTVARAQVLETETARILAKGAWETSGNLEYQTSADGEESASPWAIEYGLGKNWELLFEPVPYTAIRPASAANATGVGDTEITLAHLFLPESDTRMPALAWAAEVKLPTGRDPLIGTGEYDYTGYLIASKRLGKFDVHANLSYTILGNPVGAKLENLFGFAIGAVFRPGPAYEIFGEVLATTSSGGGEGDTTEGAIVPEAAGSEVVGTVGVGKFFGPHVLGFIGIGTDNNGAQQARLGFTLSF